MRSRKIPKIVIPFSDGRKQTLQGRLCLGGFFCSLWLKSSRSNSLLLTEIKSFYDILGIANLIFEHDLDY
jgi:hypothetical protein